MRLIGQLEHGLYIENNLTIHPEVINHYYGSRTDQVELQTITELDDSQDGGDDNEWEDVNEEEKSQVALPLALQMNRLCSFCTKLQMFPSKQTPLIIRIYKLCSSRL